MDKALIYEIAKRVEKSADLSLDELRKIAVDNLPKRDKKVVETATRGKILGLLIKRNYAYIFDENSKQVTPEVREGLFRGQELSCLIDIESNYFFNGNWGLTLRAYQVKSWGGGEQPETPQVSEPILAKGICAFLETESS